MMRFVEIFMTAAAASVRTCLFKNKINQFHFQNGKFEEVEFFAAREIHFDVTNLHFGDVTAALSPSRGAFEQLNACGEHEGQLTSALMARIFSEAQRSPDGHVRSVYESPSDSASGRAVVSGQVHKDVAAARNVAKALLAREEQ